MAGTRLDHLESQRVAAGMSLATLAKKANVSEIWLARAEAVDNPSAKGAPLPVAESQRIADALGVSLVTLGKADA